MRRLLVGGSVVCLAAVGATPAIADAPTRTEVAARMVDTLIGGVPAEQASIEPGDDPGFNWVSDNQIWHVRNLAAADTLESLDGLIEIGHIDRVIHFNVDLEDGSSTVHCLFTLTVTTPDLGTFFGHCAGSLDTGTFSANGVGQFGHLNGVYELETGGVAGVGPYVIQMTVIHR